MRFLKRTTTLLLFATVVTLGCAGSSFYFYRLAYYEARVCTDLSQMTSRHDALTVDQELAALSTNITIFGVVAAAAALALGLVAVFGYAELRATTLRKTEDDLLKIIRQLRDSGDLDNATAAVIAGAVAPDAVFATESPQFSTGVSSSESVGEASKADDNFAKPYPGEKK